MGLYETLAREYDRVFPVNPATLPFLGRPPRPGARALDLGCATGSHVRELAAAGWDASGADPSEAMVAQARSAIASPRARFELGGMLDLGRLAPPGSLSLLLCLGNTLPHLRGQPELAEFASMARRALEPGGRLVVQLLNYARILRERPAELPPLEAAGFRFRRAYRYREDGFLDFVTEFSADGQDASDTTALWPVRPEALRAALEAAGLAVGGEYSSWTREPFSAAESAILVTEAFRPA